ncbi:MAG: hypothetical protein JXA18_10665 [Chitinispirillaceae bacterium]|nr:hypothetical protein [Chitinispirillaceae bacterium]
MKSKTILLFFAAACIVAAQDITLSQDTLKIHNNTRSSTSPDSLTLVNHGADAVFLDSLQIKFEVFDTTGMIGGGFYIGFAEVFGASGIWGRNWILDKTGELSYRYVVDTSRQSEKECLSINGSGDSAVITQMVIGDCPMCAAVYYPAYLKGVLRLFYSNGQTVELQIVSSDDLRKPVRLNRAVPRYHSGSAEVKRHYLISGQKAHDNIQKLNLLHIRHIIVSKENRSK